MLQLSALERRVDLLPMRWLRCHIRRVTWLALFALATQLVLSFGHIHLDRGADATQLTQRVDETGSGAPQPGHPSDEACAICIATGLLAAAQLPPPPVVALPPSFFFQAPALIAAAPFASAPTSAFRSRAPPTA